MFKLLNHPVSVSPWEVQVVTPGDAIDRAIRGFNDTAWKGILNRDSAVSLQECMFQPLDIVVLRFKNGCT